MGHNVDIHLHKLNLVAAPCCHNEKFFLDDQIVSADPYLMPIFQELGQNLELLLKTNLLMEAKNK